MHHRQWAMRSGNLKRKHIQTCANLTETSGALGDREKQNGRAEDIQDLDSRSAARIQPDSAEIGAHFLRGVARRRAGAVARGVRKCDE